jgi:hypothetical protein
MTESTSHREEILTALLAWRAGLAELLRDRIGPAPSVRAIASRLDLGRGAAHAISRILRARDGMEIGVETPGLKIRQALLARLSETDVDHDRLQTFAVAQDRLEDLLRRHAPSKIALIAVLTESSSGEQMRARLLEGLRKRFECDAILLGASVDHLLAAQFFAPGPEGDLLNMVGIQHLSGVRQWRPDAEVELYRAFHAKRGCLGLSDESTMPLVPEASDPDWTDQVEDTEIRESPRAYVLRPGTGSASRSASSLHLGFGEYAEAIGSMVGTTPADRGEMGCPLLLPTRTLTLECWLHHDVRRGGEPEAAVYHDFRPRQLTVPERRRIRIPIPTTLTTIESDWSPPGEVDDPTAKEACRILANRAAARLGTTIDDYEVHRLVLPWPPTGGLVNISWPLASLEG